MKQRYDEVATRYFETNAGELLDELLTAAGATAAVINRGVADAIRLLRSDDELYASYYRKLNAGLRRAYHDDWERPKRMADELLFTGYREHLLFGALSADGKGLTKYGEVSLILSEHMIAHRATVLLKNSANAVKDLLGQGISTLDVAGPGNLATWNERHLLVVTKVGLGVLQQGSTHKFPALLLRSTPSISDEFIEVQIFGPITRRSLASLRTSHEMSDPDMQPLVRLLTRLCEELGVPIGRISDAP